MQADGLAYSAAKAMLDDDQIAGPVLCTAIKSDHLATLRLTRRLDQFQSENDGCLEGIPRSASAM